MKSAREFLRLVLFGAVVMVVTLLYISSSIHDIVLRYVLISENSTNSSYISSPLEKIRGILAMKGDNPTISETQCSDIVSGIAEGSWITRSLSDKEQATIDTYLREERGTYRIPSTYQRDDGLCGDVPYKDSPLYKHMWFKAICDPKGPTPCCHTNRCVALSKEDCRCPTCYDERQAIHAEYAHWKTKDEHCEVRNFTSEQACRVLEGATLSFIGDSFIRHVFATLVALLTNEVDGALKPNVPPNIRSQCTGMHQITGVNCRDHLDQDRLLCNGTVKVTYTEVFPSSQFPVVHPVLRSLRHINKSIIVLGIGIHDNFNLVSVAKNFLLPFLNLHQTLSTNLTHDVDLEKVLTNFGNFVASSAAFDVNDKVIYTAQRSAQFAKSEPQYEYLIKKNKVWSNLRTENPQIIPSFNISTHKQGFNFFSTFKAYNQIIKPFNQSENLNQTRSSNNSVVSDQGKGNNQDEGKQPSNFIHGKLLDHPAVFENDFRRQAVVEKPDKPSTGEGFTVHESMGNPSTADSLSVNKNNINLSAAEDLSTNKNTDPPTKPANNIPDPSIVFEALPKTQTDIRQLWPRLLWIGTHAPGLLKSPKFKEQTAEGVISFNKSIREILKYWKVPYLETFGFTNGVVSFDGTHYGWGVNMLKVNMLLTYIEKGLKTENEWR